jgi:hypothetical protein
MMMMVVVVVIGGKDRTCKHRQQQGSENNFLHGRNLARRWRPLLLCVKKDQVSHVGLGSLKKGKLKTQ